MLNLIRHSLGAVILAADKAFPPGQTVHRSPKKQAEVDAATAKLALYQFQACPFCVKVRRRIKKLDLNIELRDAQKNDRYKGELVMEGGEFQVPCLRIQKDDGTVEWLYESDDINRYLQQRFS